MHRGILAAAAATLIALTACTESDENAGDAPVIDPGAPGDSPSPATAERLEEAAEEEGDHNEADVEFVAMMIEHHKQALEMSDLAEDRAERDDITSIADRISDAQGAEIKAMEAWLETNVYAPAEENPNHQNYCGLDGENQHHGSNEDCPSEVDHSDMEGMASPEEMDDLEAASGDEFDTLFVELMVAHHEGGVSMAEDILIDGDNTALHQFANDVIAEQRGEIARMEQIVEG